MGVNQSAIMVMPTYLSLHGHFNWKKKRQWKKKTKTSKNVNLGIYKLTPPLHPNPHTPTPPKRSPEYAQKP